MILSISRLIKHKVKFQEHDLILCRFTDQSTKISTNQCSQVSRAWNLKMLHLDWTQNGLNYISLFRVLIFKDSSFVGYASLS